MSSKLSKYSSCRAVAPFSDYTHNATPCSLIGRGLPQSILWLGLVLYLGLACCLSDPVLQAACAQSPHPGISDVRPKRVGDLEALRLLLWWR